MGATEDAAARRVIAGEKPEGIAGWDTNLGGVVRHDLERPVRSDGHVVEIPHELA